MQATTLLAHGGHPVYDHPALAAVFVLALVIPWVVLFLVGRAFLRARDDDDKPPG
jgi:hypothetical protein